MHSALYAVHCVLCTVCCALCAVHYMLCTVQCSAVQCSALFSAVHCSVQCSAVQCSVFSAVQCAMKTIQLALCNTSYISVQVRIRDPKKNGFLGLCGVPVFPLCEPIMG